MPKETNTPSPAKPSAQSTFFPGAQQQTAQPSFFQPSPVIIQKADEADVPEKGPGEAKNRLIRQGNYADDGDYTVSSTWASQDEVKKSWKLGKQVTETVTTKNEIIASTFTNADLEQAKQYLDQKWAPKIDLNKSRGGSGDTKARAVSGMPNWVADYQGKLAAQQSETFKPKEFEKKDAAKKYNPNWDEDSVLAQRVVEAFLRAWTKKLTPDSGVPSNVAELYKRTGSSEKEFGNARATLLGDPNVFGWCGPATYNAVVLGLFKNGLRFKTGHPPITADSLRPVAAPGSKGNKAPTDEKALILQAFMAEINRQAAFLIGNSTSKDPGAGYLTPDKFPSGTKAYTEPLAPGDVITQALMNGSPLSGHVLTVVKEIPEKGADPAKPGTVLSRIYGISGNAGSIGGGSVKIEEFVREVPPANLQADLDKFSVKGNAFTVAKSLNASIEKQVKSEIIKKENVAPAKVSEEKVKTGVEAARKEKLDAAIVELAAFKVQFANETGVDYDAMVEFERELAKTKKPSQDQRTQGFKYQQIRSQKKALVASIKAAQGTIKAINDFTELPKSSAVDNIPFDTTSPLYGQQVGGMGRFRPNEKGHMWITSFIRASAYTDATAINKDISSHKDTAFNQVLGGTITMEQFTAEMKAYKENVLGSKGLEQMTQSVNELWPGAMAAIEGEGLAAEQGPDGRIMKKE